MSILPLYNALLTGLLLVSLFLWKIWLLPIVLFLSIISLVFFWFDLMKVKSHYESAFWLFILSETIAFGMLLLCCVWFDTNNFIKLSYPLEIPFLGCFLLLGSSITVTGFHHLMNFKFSWILLLLTIILGIAFVILQIYEMKEIWMKIYDTSFHARSLCTVGLHFSHVVVGIIGLSAILLITPLSSGFYRCRLITWYWHFVDYIWLFVYTFVYVC